MKKTFSSLLLILCISGAQAAMIKDSKTDLVLKTEVKDGAVTLYKCQNSLNEETLNYEVKCIDKPLGNKSHDLDDLADKLDSMEKNNSYRFYTKLAFTIVPAVLVSKKFVRGSHITDRASLLFVLGLGSAIGGSVGYTD